MAAGREGPKHGSGRAPGFPKILYQVSFNAN